MSRRQAEKPRTLKEMSQGGRSQPLEWAMVHTLAWKHDIAKGRKTAFYHSVQFAPSLPVKHAICPRHRSSCWLIECDRAIHTLLQIRHHLLKKKKKITTTAQWRAVRQRAPTSAGPRLKICLSGGGRGQRPGVILRDTVQTTNQAHLIYTSLLSLQQSCFRTGIIKHQFVKRGINHSSGQTSAGTFQARKQMIWAHTRTCTWA